MRKIDIKKKKKKIDLMEIAYEMFSTVGYENTSILNIALRAGVGKGTFYLYFDSKEAIRDELVALKSSQLLHDSIAKLKAQEEAEAGASVTETGEAGCGTKAGLTDAEATAVVSSGARKTPEEKITALINCTIDMISDDIPLLKFISKNLSWGIFKRQTSIGGDEIIDFQKFVLDMLSVENIKLKNPELFVFTTLELVNSTCYSVIVENEPVSLEEYKPYLNECIRLLLAGNIMK